MLSLSASMPNLAELPKNITYLDRPNTKDEDDGWRGSEKLLTIPRWRLNNLYKIVSKQVSEAANDDDSGDHSEQVQHQIMTFRMNWAQESFYNDMWSNNIILKARQLGFSTFIEILILDNAMWRKNFRATIIAHGKEEASALFRTKILFAYNNLPNALRQWCPAVAQSQTAIRFANGSEIVVSVSARSGTNHFLHISEFGKICRKYPEKADEIVSGSFETVHGGGVIAIESTAEGHSGHFYDMSQRAQNLMYSATLLTKQDYRFFFFPWHMEPTYTVDDATAERTIIPERLENYFLRLEHDYGIELSRGQMVWYSKKEEIQGTLMFREHPSFPEEAFQARIEGSVYGEKIAQLRMQGRLGSFPINTSIPVETWWDIGIGDYTVILLTQTIGGRIHIVDWVMNNGEGLDWYTKWLSKKKTERHFFWGKHIGPHDFGQREWGSKGKTRIQLAAELGYKIDRAPARGLEEGINLARVMFPMLCFDERYCGDLLDMLATYQYEWDAHLGAYKNTPKHDEASHPADALRTGILEHPFAARVRARSVPEKHHEHIPTKAINGQGARRIGGRTR